jgi:predicted house-cleaning noncanonical NTP pyrophosphatase (MazG superfamily)
MKKDHKVYHNKLVRDKVIDQLRAKGIEVDWRVLSADEELPRFIEKLIEESKEVAKAAVAGNRAQLLEEFADVWDVARELERLTKPTPGQLNAAASRSPRGTNISDLPVIAQRIAQLPSALAQPLAAEFLAILSELVKAQGFSNEELAEAIAQKRMKRGGFDKCLFLISTEEAQSG